MSFFTYPFSNILFKEIIDPPFHTGKRPLKMHFFADVSIALARRLLGIDTLKGVITWRTM